METWKLLLGVAALLAMFAAVVTLAGRDISPAVLVGVLIILTIGLVVMVRSYRVGQDIGAKMAEDGDE